MNNNKAIFLDRDGILNAVSIENDEPQSPRRFADFRLLPDIEEPLKNLKSLGFFNIVITNQPDIARGFLDKKELAKMHQLIKERLAIDEILVCPHDDKDKCACRKPKPGLIWEAVRKWGIDLVSSYVIGDTKRDMEAGKSAGCKTVLLSRPYNKDYHINYDFKVNSLNEFAELLRRREV